MDSQFNHNSNFVKKFDFNELISNHRVDDVDNFTNYLAFIWRDLSKKNPNLGISKSIFSKVFF